MGLFEGGSGDRRSGAESVRRFVAGLGCTPAEALALAVLAVGAVAVLGVLWFLARPGPPAGDGSGSPPTAAPGADEPVTGPQLEAEDLVVHVAGEVASLGLHELPVGACVADALEAAGGPTDEALTAALNLAREVSDGEQLYVPGPEEAALGGDAAGGQRGGPVGGSRNPAPGSSAWRPDGRLDLNRATTDDLEELDGIGEILTECGICHVRLRVARNDMNRVSPRVRRTWGMRVRAFSVGCLRLSSDPRWRAEYAGVVLSVRAGVPERCPNSITTADG